MFRRVVPYLKQLKSILLHKWYFFKSGHYLGLPLSLLVLHDVSKFAPVELVNYTRWFHGGKDKAGWAKAWRHHAHNNKHHPEHYVFSWRGDPDFYSEIGERLALFVTVLAMPEIYVREMVADWMAASKMFTNSYNIDGWVCEHGRKMLLHSDTVTILHSVMNDAGFVCTDNCDFSFMAASKFREWEKC